MVSSVMWRMSWCHAITLLLACVFVSAFNFAPKYAKVFSDPTGDTSSRFGYTVALRKETNETSSTTGILIGAPLGNSEVLRRFDIDRPGNIYWCPLVGNETCKETVIDTTPQHNLPRIQGKRDLSYFASSLDTEDSGNGFAVCAPHWRNEHVPGTSFMNGMCYWKQDTTQDTESIFTLYELEYQALKDGVETVIFAYGEAGFSVAVNQNDREILIGAPGVYIWKGAVLRYNIEDRKLHRPLPDSTYPERVENNTYFGYTVGYGHFPDSNETAYIAGAPRGADYRGKVYMFNFVNTSGLWDYDILKEWEGTQMGEYFGSSLAIADFNNDGFDDILIGAPLHSLESNNEQSAVGDEGCVYMFITNSKSGWEETGKQNMLMGLEKHNARFGTAISVLGDINMDGYPDVAIGAPYEDDSSGVVYIYHGSRSGLNPEYSQRLVAQEIDPNLRGFGFSISKGFDIDGNFYNDLAIGAHHSNNAVLVKTYPIVTILPDIIPSVSRIGFSDREFNASACVSYVGNYAPKKIDVLITVKADPMYKRANFLDGGKVFTYNTTLEYNSQDCKNFTLSIEERKEFYRPIDIAVEYEVNSQKKRELSADESPSFCKDCPVINGTNIHWWKIPYGLGCKQDTNCSIDLEIKATFVNVTSPFVIGTKDFIAFKMELESKNDPAYFSKMSVIFPYATQHRRIPADCQENGTSEFRQLVCDVDGPLKKGMKHTLDLELDMTNVPLDMQYLEINISAISSDVDSNESNNHVQLRLPLQTKFNVDMIGNSEPEQIGFVSKKKSTNGEVILDKEFSHTYLVTNNGPTPVKMLALDFSVPYGLYIGKKFVELLDVSTPMVDMQRQHLSCKTHKNSDSLEEGVVRSAANRHAAGSGEVASNRTLTLDCSQSHVRCMDVHCTMDRQFVKKTGIMVSFPIKTKLKKYELILKNKDSIIVITTGQARLTENELRKRTVQIVLWRTLPEQGVSWWIILLSIIGGILILAAIIWCFYKFGFFKRNKQMQLQAMKHKSLQGPSGLDACSLADPSCSDSNPNIDDRPGPS